MLSVVVPVRDERDNLRPLFRRLDDALIGVGAWEVVFVDDGSVDGSARVLADLAAQDGRVRVVTFARPFGQSAAMQAGLDHAAGRVIATMDGDGQNDPADLPRMLAKLEDGYDVVLGERVDRRDGLWLKKLPSWCANWLIRRATRVPFKDFGCTLRVMRREVADGLALYGERHRFLTAFAVQNGARAAQVPVNHFPRTAGRSKYDLTRTARVLVDLAAVQYLARYRDRPMHFFGPLGLALLALGALGALAGLTLPMTAPLVLGALLALAGGQSLGLGLLGEALARDAAARAPGYRVRQTLGFGPRAGRLRRVA